MSTATFYVTPGYGDLAFKDLGYSQAVRIGDRVETSGQGGWDDRLAVCEDLDDEIVQAFDNLERTLATAGATWRDVVHINSYHKIEAHHGVIGADHNDVMVREFRRRLGGRAPVWTQTGVTVLGLPAMRIELRATAVIEDDSPTP